MKSIIILCSVLFLLGCSDDNKSANTEQDDTATLDEVFTKKSTETAEEFFKRKYSKLKFACKFNLESGLKLEEVPLYEGHSNKAVSYTHLTLPTTPYV